MSASVHITLIFLMFLSLSASVYLFFVFLKKKSSNKNKALEKQKGMKIEEVLPGDKILYTGRLGLCYSGMTCINNDSENKKIYVKISYTNADTLDHEVISYDDARFKNFELINFIDTKIDIKVRLELEIKECERVENYEKAKILKETLDKLK